MLITVEKSQHCVIGKTGFASLADLGEGWNYVCIKNIQVMLAHGPDFEERVCSTNYQGSLKVRIGWM